MTTVFPVERERGPNVCGCGCNTVAVYRCEGFDFDPKAKDGRGKPFTELACATAAEYLHDSSAELGFPFTMERL